MHICCWAYPAPCRCDTTKPRDVRAKAFVAALQTAEKIPLMTNEAQGVKRLHIPPYQWGSEGLHGGLCVVVCDKCVLSA